VAKAQQLTDERLKAFERLLNIMDDLREKCPWDRKQTLQSLRHLTIEETYELADAILENDLEGVKEELGDLIMHMVFYAKIGSEKKAFDITDALNHVCDKLVQRHPHIYGDVEVADEEEVKANWEQLKLKEGKKSVLGGVPVSLPALVKAYRIQEKAKQVGFEWEEIGQVWEKVEEEMEELKTLAHQTGTNGSRQKLEEEFGDLLFALINYARYLKVDPEMALAQCNKKFISRFRYIEAHAAKSGRDLKTMTLEEMDALWEEAKKTEHR